MYSYILNNSEYISVNEIAHALLKTKKKIRYKFKS